MGMGLAVVVVAELPNLAVGLVCCWATTEAAAVVVVEGSELGEDPTC